MKKSAQESKIEKLISEPRAVLHQSERLVRSIWKLTKLLSKRGQYVFIACMPKTASTFLSFVLSELTGFTRVTLYEGLERTEQEPYLPKIIDAYSFPSVTQQHMKATRYNLRILRAFSIKPVILVRNIFDIPISLREYFFEEGLHKSFAFFANKNFADLDEQTQLDCIIELSLPWFIDFYVSWFEACRTGRIDAMWLTYEEAVTDWKATLQKVLNFYKIKKSDQEIEDALQKTLGKGSQKVVNIRLNKGFAGRGRLALTQSQKDKIIGLTRFYPWVDFTRLGIPRVPQGENSYPAVK